MSFWRNLRPFAPALEAVTRPPCILFQWQKLYCVSHDWWDQNYEGITVLALLAPRLAQKQTFPEASGDIFLPKVLALLPFSGGTFQGFPGLVFLGNSIHGLSHRFWKGYRVIYHLPRHLKGIFKMPNVCSLSSALHFHSSCMGAGTCGSPQHVQGMKTWLLCVHFTAGRSGLMWLITYNLLLICLHLRNRSWTAELNGMATSHALRRHWGGGGTETGPQAALGCGRKLRVGKKLFTERGSSRFQWTSPSPRCHFPFLLLYALCCIIPTAFSKTVSKFKHLVLFLR